MQIHVASTNLQSLHKLKQLVTSRNFNIYVLLQIFTTVIVCLKKAVFEIILFLIVIFTVLI